MIVRHDHLEDVLNRINQGQEPLLLESMDDMKFRIIQLRTGQKKWVEQFEVLGGYVFYKILDFVE